jgi:hypothetical protein
LIGKPERKRPPGKPKCRWRIISLRDIGWGIIDWIHLTQDRDQWRALVNMVINLRVP